MHCDRIVQACIDMNIDIMQFQQHCARADKQNANFDQLWKVDAKNFHYSLFIIANVENVTL